MTKRQQQVDKEKCSRQLRPIVHHVPFPLVFPFKAVGLRASRSSWISFLPLLWEGFCSHQKMFLVKKKKSHNQTTVLYPRQMLCQTLRSATLVCVFRGFEQLCVEQLHLCKPRAGGPGQTFATHSHKAEKSDRFLDSPKMFGSSSFFSFYFSIK